MAYIRIGEDESTFGSFGCGPGCGCAGCQRTAGSLPGLGERYVPEEEEDAPPPRTPPQPEALPPAHLTGWGRFGEPPLRRRPLPTNGVRLRMPAFGAEPMRPAPSAMEGFGQPSPPAQPAGPVFDVQCPDPPGCPPVAAGQCRAVLRQAIIEAIKLANNAASKIQAATKLEPSKRDAETKKTADLFKFFFGHDPTRPVPWAGNEASGTSVAYRFRAVARELGGGRRIVFRCLVARPGCADDDLTCCSPDANAWVNQAIVPNVVHLCALFWNPPAGLRGLPPPYYRAGVLIHEMLHLLFQDFLLHSPPGRPNAHCYEAFALRIAGFGADPFDVRQCRARPA
jgi:hypothetical protein